MSTMTIYGRNHVRCEIIVYMHNENHTLITISIHVSGDLIRIMIVMLAWQL